MSDMGLRIKMIGECDLTGQLANSGLCGKWLLNGRCVWFLSDYDESLEEDNVTTCFMSCAVGYANQQYAVFGLRVCSVW